MLHSSPGPVPGPPLKAYRPRLFGYAELWNVEDFRIKVYTISHKVDAHGSAFDTGLLGSVRSHVEDRMTEVHAEGGHYGVGYLILHEGKLGYWLLFDWWAHGDICCQLLSRADSDRPSDLRPVSSPVMACVWESFVIAFERDAWIDTMMCEAPDPEAYLARTMPPGLR